MNLPNIEDFTLANYSGIEPYANEDTYEEPVKQEVHQQMVEPQQTPTQVMRRIETDLRTTADTSSAQAKSDRANYRNMGSKSPAAKAKPLEQTQRVHSIERTLEKSRDEKKLRFEKMRNQISGKSCSQITRAKTLNLKEMDLQALKSGDGNTNSSFNLTKAADNMNRSLLPSDQQEQTFVPLSVLLESNTAEADSPLKSNLLEGRSKQEHKSAIGKQVSQSKNLEQLINDGSRRNIPNFEGLLDRGLSGKQVLTQSLMNQQGDSRADLGLGNPSETERKVLLERPRDWKLAASITASGGKKNQTQQPSFANKSSSQVSDFSGISKPKDDTTPLYSKDFSKSMLSRFKNYPLAKTQDLSGSQHLERKTYEPFHNSSVLTQTTEGNLLHGLTPSPDGKTSTANTERIKQVKVSANSSERTLKKQGSSASNKSISLIENLHSRLNRKFSNRSITKIADAKKELVGRRTGTGPTDTSSRADSASSSTHKLTSIGHLVSDLNIYSQPMKKEHSPAAHLHNSKHYYDRLSREGRKILGINRTHSNTGSVGRQSDSGSVGSVGRENPSLNIYRSKK